MKAKSSSLASTLFLALSLATSQQLRAAAGDLYISDNFYGTIVQSTTTQSGSSYGDFATGLQNPYGLAFDKAGNLFVAAAGPGKILKVATDGSYTNFANEPGRFNAMAFHPNGNLFVADYNIGFIDSISPKGVVTNYAFGLTQPAGMVFDHAGNMYVTERSSNIVTKYNGVRSVFSSGLVAPTGIAIDSADNIYVVEQNGSLYRLAANGTKAATIATGFGSATALAIDAAGNLYVTQNYKPPFTAAVTERIKPDGSRTIMTASNKDLEGIAVAPAGHLVNISTRASVETGDNALIAGFITTGTGSANLVVRGLGPSLAAAGINNALQDPTLDLAVGSTVLASNDNWKDTQQTFLQGTGIAPSDNRESAIARYLSPSAYTAALRGKNNGTGSGLVEVYDLSPSFETELANISTRGQVGTGDNVLIAGFIISGGQATVVRALGPSLTAAGVNGALQDPYLVVRDANGFPVAFDNDWKQHQQAAITATGLAPKNDRESASLITLVSGTYTAVVSGFSDTTGVGLVEVYKLK